MSRKPRYIPGDQWAECQSCGMVVRSSKIKKRWDGLLVCPKDYETRHPQDFVRAREDNSTPTGYVSPESPDQFVTVTRVDTTTAIPSGTFTTNNEEL